MKDRKNDIEPKECFPETESLFPYFSEEDVEITTESFQKDTPNKPFLIVCCGLGRDSVAMLVLFKQLNIRPDLIIFADVGNEKAKTYSYIPVLRNWLRSAG